MKAEYFIYIAFIALALFVGYKVIKAEKDDEPNYSAGPEFNNPF